MRKLILNYKGWDNWDRPVYESEGRLYVDVTPRKGYRPLIYTKCDNDFYGEPDMPVALGTEIEFVPCRYIW